MNTEHIYPYLIRQTAYHEAGHAVMALYHGGMPTYLMVDEKGNGRCCNSRLYDYDMEKNVEVALAGYEAMEVHKHEAPDGEEILNSEDWEEAFQRLEEQYEWEGKDTSELALLFAVNNIRKSVKRILASKPWKEMTKVIAEALMERREMWDSDVSDLVLPIARANPSVVSERTLYILEMSSPHRVVKPDTLEDTEAMEKAFEESYALVFS